MYYNDDQVEYCFSWRLAGESARLISYLSEALVDIQQSSCKDWQDVEAPNEDLKYEDMQTAKMWWSRYCSLLHTALLYSTSPREDLRFGILKSGVSLARESGRRDYQDLAFAPGLSSSPCLGSLGSLHCSLIKRISQQSSTHKHIETHSLQDLGCNSKLQILEQVTSHTVICIL